MNATRLVLIRHGITKWNIQRRYCGYKDINLSSQGRRQAVRLRKKLKRINFDRIYSSDRKRALQTEAILFGKAEFLRVRDLREMHFGVLEGRTHEQILKKYPEAYKLWLKDPYKGRISEAESLPAFKRRVIKSMNMIARLNPGKTVAVVCHGGVIAIFVSSLLKSKKFWDYVVSPASVTIVKYKNSKFKLVKFNKKLT